MAYDKNQNFGPTEQLEPVFKLSLPDPSTYFDVNADSALTGTALDNLVDYLAQYNKELDKQTVQRLYNERTIRYFRLSHQNDNTYIGSSCYAEYRKGISYDINLLIDKHGSVLEAQCECPAEGGPSAHCKHVCIVMYGAIMLTNNKAINVEETCTQKFQSFHKCKRFLGSPFKTLSLNMSGADEFTNMEFDPKPQHLRNMPGYQDHFRNTCLNFSGFSEMPIFQTFEPANALAVAHDHDYLRLTPEDRFLERISVLNTTRENITAIEERTRGQAKNIAWKLKRTKRLTSSMLGRICKATDRTDKIILAKSFTLLHDVKATPLEHGKKHESVAINKYIEDTGNNVKQCGLFVSIDFPYLASSPDGLLSQDDIIEVRCPFVSRDKPIIENTAPFLKYNTKKTILFRTTTIKSRINFPVLEQKTAH